MVLINWGGHSFKVNDNGTIYFSTKTSDGSLVWFQSSYVSIDYIKNCLESDKVDKYFKENIGRFLQEYNELKDEHPVSVF